ncbi:MAG: GntR family transcriptional regulator [Spirochaetia bacterium]|nr:GntR family transcriptional regulator [Spirochaetia bacterium]
MPPIVRVTASEEIYQALRSEILSLRFKPGEELNLQLLSVQLQVSRSPVRDALMRLSSDNLVDIFPQKGTRVSLIDLKQVEEERFLRKSLEESAVKKFIHLAKEEHFVAMKKAIDEQQSCADNKDFVNFLEVDNQYHAIIFKAIGMQRIWKIINAQGGNHHRIRLLSFYEKNVLPNIIEQHQHMLQACKEKNLDAILKLEDKHLSKLLQETESMVEHYPQYFKQENIFSGLQLRVANQ